jgi:hypothetical protein
MKRKIYYNADPTPSPECQKLIDAYNKTCENYNDKVKEYKKMVKDNIDKCEKDIVEWEKEKKNLEKEIKNIQAAFDAVALKFANAMPKTQKFKDMINMGVKFYRGNFNQNVNGVQGVGMNLNDNSPGIIEQANCYINYTYTTNRNGTKNYRLGNPVPQDFSPANAAKAIAVIVNLRHRNADLPRNDAGNRQRNTNRFLSEPELQKLGFVNDVVTAVLKGPDGNFVIENGEPVVRKRNHNGKLSILKDENGNYLVDAGGFKLIREFAEDFINDKDSQQVIKDLKSKVDKDARLKTLDGLIAECKSYIKNELKNGIPINFRRKVEKNEIDRFIKNFKETLDNRMEKIKKEGCTAPTKCVEPTLIR